MAAEWRKAPLVLVRHPAVLVAVFVAALLAALAASSAPFVTTAAASEALKDRLAELTSFATGVEVQSSRQLFGTESAAGSTLPEPRLVGRPPSCGSRIGHVARPVLTMQTASPGFGQPVALVGPAGGTSVVLMARDGALGHVTVLSRVSGAGIWISDITAHAAGVQAGDTVKLTGLESLGRPDEPLLRVKGVYRALAHAPQTDYWTNFFQEIYPQGIDAPVPPSFVFVSPARLNGLVAGSQMSLTNTVELPIDPAGLTLQAARGLRHDRRTSRPAARLEARPRTRLRREPFSGRQMHGDQLALGGGDPRERERERGDAGGHAALRSRRRDRARVSRPRRASSSFGAAAPRPRCSTPAASTSRVFAGRTAQWRWRCRRSSAARPGSCSRTRSPTCSRRPGRSRPGTVWSAARACRRRRCGRGSACWSRPPRLVSAPVRHGLARPRLAALLPLGAAVLAAAPSICSCAIRSGGGISASSARRARTDARGLRLPAAARRRGRRAGGAARTAAAAPQRPAAGPSARPPVYLALRRLAAARGLVVVLAVVAAVSLGSLFYVETLAGSLEHTTIEKAYMATGSDASATRPGRASCSRLVPLPGDAGAVLEPGRLARPTAPRST